MSPWQIVHGQAVSARMRERARRLRRTMTPQERVLWEQLREHRLHGLHFRRQQVIGYYIVDFYCHDAALVVEVDGNTHQQQREYDAQRDEYLSSHGLHIVRITNTRIEHNLSAVLFEIATICTERLSQPSEHS